MAATRRLAAIMFTDMVGFSTAVQSNEADALSSLKEQEDLVRPVLTAHRGRDIKSTGDGFLVEFDSALRAVQCAIAIHEAIRERNSIPGRSPFLLRIGVHLGDVEERNGDIFGDAVNIAARIEPLAPPGGICISGSVFDQVHNKIGNRLDKLPPAQLKHIQQSVDVYRLTLPWDEPQASAASMSRKRLAVLPLANISPDPKDEYFADGLTEELIGALSKIRELRVIARTSVTQYKGTSKPVAQIGSELNVGSVLEGSVRKSGDRLRISLQLIDTSTQEHLWAQSYDRRLDDVFAIQTEVAEQTAHGLRVELVAPERESIESQPTTNVAAYTLYLQGIHSAHQLDMASITASIPLFEQAIRLDPEFSMAYSGLAESYLYLSGETIAPGEALPKAMQLVTRALELDPASSDAHTARGNVALQLELNWKLAESEFRTAIALNPSNAEAHWWNAILLRTLRRFAEAEAEMNRVVELDPLWGAAFFGRLQIHLAGRNFTEAERLLREKLGADEGSSSLRMYLAAVLALQGRLDEARAENAKLPATLPPQMQENRAALWAFLGNPTEARKVVAELEERSKTQFVSKAVIAVYYSILGETEKAFEWLEKDYDSGERGLWFRYLDAPFDNIRGDPRFDAMLRRMNLPTK